MANMLLRRKRLGRRAHLGTFLLLAIMLLSLLLSACGNPSTQTQAEQNKTVLDKEIAHARSIGVPESMLKSITDQAQQLSQSNVPFSLFSDQPAKDYYGNLATSYQMLTLQVSNLESKATQQTTYQALQGMSDFQNMLNQRRSQGYVEVTTFSNMYNQYQQEMDKAQYPKDFLAVENEASDATDALRMLGTAFDKLTTLQNVSTQFKNSNLDTTAIDQSIQSDTDQLRKASTSKEYNNILDQLDAQLQSTVTVSAQSIPFVGGAKLKQLSDAIDTMKKYEGDTTNFQQRLDKDRQALTNAKTLKDYIDFSSQIDKDLSDIRVPSLAAQAKFVVKDYHTQVTNWRNTHVWHNPFDGQDYKLGNEYDSLDDGYGVGTDIDASLASSQTADDYQATIDFTNLLLTNFQAMTADYGDSTPWNQPHATDKQLMDHYQVGGGMVIVASILEQTARIYQNGQLIRSAQFASGRYSRPSPPGFTHIFNKRSPAKFVSVDNPSSPFYFEPITLKYELGYHTGEYYFHDVTWRGVFGTGDGYRSNLPHADPVDQKDGGDGSHGCINLQQDEAGWWYNNIPEGTPVIVY